MHQWRQQQAREDRRAALVACILANVNRNDKERSEPFDLQEVVSWLGHTFWQPQQEEPPPSQPTPEALLERAKMLNQMYNESSANGTE